MWSISLGASTAGGAEVLSNSLIYAIICEEIDAVKAMQSLSILGINVVQ
jgi:hypothetical protein